MLVWLEHGDLREVMGDRLKPYPGTWFCRRVLKFVLRFAFSYRQRIAMQSL